MSPTDFNIKSFKISLKTMKDFKISYNNLLNSVTKIKITCNWLHVTVDMVDYVRWSSHNKSWKRQQRFNGVPGWVQGKGTLAKLPLTSNTAFTTGVFA